MPTLAESIQADTSQYKAAPVSTGSVTAPVDIQSQGQGGFMRTTLPPVWSSSPDSLRTFYTGGVVPQTRLLTPTPQPIVTQNITNVTQTTQAASSSGITTSPRLGFTNGNNSNGYWEKDPLGKIEQWAQAVSLGSGDFSITFPIPFTNAVSISIIAIVVYPSGDTGYVTVVAGSISTTGFTLHQNNLTGMAANWFAVGY